MSKQTPMPRAESATSQMGRPKARTKKAGTNPREYSVLEVDMRLVPGARTHQDLHSKSGIVADRVDRIPPYAIRLVDRELDLPTSVSTTGA